MCINRKFLITSALIISLLVSGCKPGSALSPTGDSAILKVQLTPSLLHWQPRLQGCALSMEAASLILEVLPPQDLVPGVADVLIRFGTQEPGEDHLSVLTGDQLVIVTDLENPLKEISVRSLEQIFSGKVNKWQDLPEGKQAGYQLGISPALFEQNNDLSLVLTSFLKFDFSKSIISQKVSTYPDLIAYISTNPGSIGYMLNSQVDAGVKTLPVIDEEGMPISLAAYVLAITADYPTGDLLQLILCLQNPG